ncbi:MarR family winged helix-turn-helix transcriptional regulator [Alsobacter sp. KACC 23698]|uniref:MarR family winged helix-turn-helix transcriptional regulator n=1 Tax=Alsobacter sp. KACC 23698 TaxID=3149229 RepID=A0AAU7JK46_9HYPH
MYLHVMNADRRPEVETPPYPEGLPPDLPLCFARSAIMAARSLMRVYNAFMRETGLQMAQFSVLAAFKIDRYETLSHLADALALERTTLLRNIDQMRRSGLVAPVQSSGRGKRYRLTPKGEEAMARALPFWRKAQDAFTAELGPDAAQSYRRELARLRRTADALAARLADDRDATPPA